MKFDFEVEGEEKNTSKSKIENTLIGEGVFMVQVHHDGEEPIRLKRSIEESLIQFYFGVEGSARFYFGGGGYTLDLQKAHSLLFYNPLKALPLDIEVAPGSKMVFLYLSVESLHHLFVAGSEEIAFLNQENINKKFYTDKDLNPKLTVTLNQLFSADVQGPARPVFRMAKAYEILALYFTREEGKDTEQCPFLNDEENVERIRLAKKILIDRMTNPPSLKELAREIGLNDYRLKEGFKNIYGKTVFQFLNDYRLDAARNMLEKEHLKVNDVAYHIGYTNPSHFIAAFKKKFGVTPKKYLMHS